MTRFTYERATIELYRCRFDFLCHHFFIIIIIVMIENDFIHTGTINCEVIS